MTDRNSIVLRSTPGAEDGSHQRDVTLMRSLHKATRSNHTKLNQLILSRLPLCLPPHTAQPDLYALGLLHFAPIYVAFEAAWQLLCEYEPTSQLSLETAVVLSSLIHLHVPSLLRTKRLRQDLSLLLQQPTALIDVRLRHPDGQKAREFVRHVKDVACYKPHALIAYTWVMYMALFNGGRWIREQLSTARDLAWDLNKDALELTTALKGDLSQDEIGLSFWQFEGVEDGDDIKTDYKARLVDVGTMLSPEHRADIVQEANEIFERCLGLVNEIDRSLASDVDNDHFLDVDAMRLADTKRTRRTFYWRVLSIRMLPLEFPLIFVITLSWAIFTIRLPQTLFDSIAETSFSQC